METPLYDYTTHMNIPLYRRANWLAFHKLIARRYGLAILILLPVLMVLFAVLELGIDPSSPTTEVLLRAAPRALIPMGIAISIAYLYLVIYSALAINKVCKGIAGLAFHTSLSESGITLRNPVNGTVKTYPYTIFQPFINHPEFIMLKAEHEYIFVGKEGLNSVNALEFFENQIASKS